MKIKTDRQLDAKQEVLALGLFDDDDLGKYKELSMLLTKAIEKKSFEKIFGSTFSARVKDSNYESTLVVALGKEDDFSVERLRRVMNKIVEHVRKYKHASFTTDITSKALQLPQMKGNARQLGRASAEGLILGDYAFDKYLTKSKKNPRKEISGTLLVDSSANDFSQGLQEGIIISEATNYAKDMVNEPANVMTPSAIESRAKEIAKSDAKIKIKVLNKPEMQKLGLNALLGVALGSDKDSKLIIIQYANSKDKPVAIVGKGITFDSGGYNLKPEGSMQDMKCDMSGAAAVLGTIMAASKLGLKKNILGIIPSCENLINGSAQKPGDIVTAYNGKTIEIGNTDAEGRLILADAVAYTEANYAPEIIIDLATLTGACVAALGFYASGLFTNDDKLGDDLLKAGFASYDRLWKLPFFEDYQDNMDGDISDLNNMATRNKGQKAAGAITGAVFISKFVDKAKWAHLDIAGPAFLAEAKDYNQKYATGAGVRVLTYYFMG